ncbi:LexA family protein [Pseudomonas typographi]|uniref:Helix-turn-helix domain-containing protein n=1 Tax=Pseudomonas typographi TaxID=2715964 RepID=A0ABR7Z9G3_9PSED|nr:S24 family peptidase [Pseudomonas typographi]MBD1602194.1 helix-turn-helix domain-containing protein [Pseudomonas typographi]
MDNWIALVKQQMRVQRITQEKLAERVGASQGAVNHWLAGRREPDIATMNRVLQALGLVSLEVATVLRTQEARAQYGAPLPEGALPGEGYRYPCLSWQEAAASGERCSAKWLFSDYRARGLAYWLPVNGDAMTAPLGWSVAAGMWILVDPGRAYEPGCLVVAQPSPEEGLIFRQWVEDAGLCYLRPLNPMWPTLQVPEHCQVHGVVVAAVANFLPGGQH